MSLIFTEAFNLTAFSYLLDWSEYWTKLQFTSTFSLAAAIKRTGYASLKTNASYYNESWSSDIRFSSSQGNTFTMGFGLYISAAGTGGDWKLFSLIDPTLTSRSIELYIRDGQHIVLKRDGVDIGVTSLSFVLSNWYYVEWTVYMHATLGYCIVDIEGENYINAFGINTTNIDSTTGWRACRMHNMPSSGEFGYFDDYYIRNDNIRHGKNTRVYTLVPSAIGDSTEFTPVGAANNWQNVDDIPQNLNDYNYADTESQHKDLFQIQDLSSTVVYIEGVNLKVLANRHASETSARAAGILKVGSTEHYTTTKDLVANYLQVEKLFPNNPNTSLQWTLEDVNSLQIGYYDPGS